MQLFCLTGNYYALKQPHIRAHNKLVSIIVEQIGKERQKKAMNKSNKIQEAIQNPDIASLLRFNTPTVISEDIVAASVDSNKSQKQKIETAGKDWFDMPSTNLTPEIKRDIQLIGMRGTLDPKRFYKKDKDLKKIPKVFQVIILNCITNVNLEEIL